MKNSLLFALVALAFSLASPVSSSLHAQTINWGTGAQNITADTDVRTTGILTAAFNIGPAGVAATTVNGVTFSPFAFPASTNNLRTVTLGNFQFTETNNSRLLASSNTSGSTAAPFTTLSSGYQTLLSSAGGATFLNTLNLTMSGLTAGQSYLFEFWSNNSLGGTQQFSSTADTVIATAGNSVTVDTNTATSNVAGGLGQYAVGTFTATGTTYTIGFDGGTAGQVPLINAFELRAVPEPSTWAGVLLGAGLLGLTLRLQQRRTRLT